ncbi:uncharacterized protein LOC108148604 [Drosophila elegans]|uniref:uncharacterized protein LOC108148604 n=1 Tax=Drosophila elegans TaxID=30023 RepID=UPI0007E7A1CF|nr:uncharacterized protein LOC108148604 [Drosophila elegans]
MYFKGVLLFLLVIFYINITQIDSKVEFTNIKCNSRENKFLDFEYCYIKSVNRSYKYISLKANLHEVPIKNASANLQILKRFRTYMPITMNITFDVCKYMETKKHFGNPMLKLFEKISKNYTNVNHKCPYDHDLYIDKLPTQFLNQHFTDVLPLPPGDYAFYSSWYSKGIERATIRIYATLT